MENSKENICIKDELSLNLFWDRDSLKIFSLEFSEHTQNMVLPKRLQVLCIWNELSKIRMFATLKIIGYSNVLKWL